MQIPRPLANVITVIAMLALTSAASAREESLHFVDGDGFRDLYFGDQPVVRYVTPKYVPANRDATLKPFVHVYGFHNEGYITKGAGGMETHHRGLFIGFKTQFGNFWSCADCYQQHQKYLVERESVGGDSARMASLVDWITNDGKPVIRETREITARRVSEAQLILDFDITLESLAGEIDLGGDPHHGGFHFRAAEEVQGQATTKPSVRTGLARYIRPTDAKLLKDDTWSDTAWAACLFEIKDNPYVVVHMNHPGNPGPVTYSTRPYGRFGAFLTTRLVPGKPLNLRYRIIIVDGKTNPTPESLAALYEQYVK